MIIARIIFFSFTLLFLSCASNKVTFKNNVVTSKKGVNTIHIKDSLGTLLASYTVDSIRYFKFNLNDIESLFEMRYSIDGFSFIEDSTYEFRFYPSYDSGSVLFLKQTSSGNFVIQY